ncbi:MAG TPA: hypothetical protein VGD43_04980 [Micromonospora sp.]
MTTDLFSTAGWAAVAQKRGGYGTAGAGRSDQDRRPGAAGPVCL